MSSFSNMSRESIQDALTEQKLSYVKKLPNFETFYGVLQDIRSLQGTFLNLTKRDEEFSKNVPDLLTHLENVREKVLELVLQD